MRGRRSTSIHAIANANGSSRPADANEYEDSGGLGVSGCTWHTDGVLVCRTSGCVAVSRCDHPHQRACRRNGEALQSPVCLCACPKRVRQCGRSLIASLSTLLWHSHSSDGNEFGATDYETGWVPVVNAPGNGISFHSIALVRLPR